MAYSLTTLNTQRKRNEKMKRLGLCVRCGKKAEPNKTKCKVCSEKERKQSAIRRRLQKELGVKISGRLYKEAGERKAVGGLDD